MITNRRTFGRHGPAVLLALVLLPVIAAAYDWSQFDGNPRHSGSNNQETTITPSNVSSLRRLFQVSLPSVADGAPAYLSGVSAAGGARDLIFATGMAGHIIALDAHTGSQIWSRQSPAGSCRINNGSSVCYTTSSPAVDPDGQYVYSYGLDGYVHKYRVTDGSEVTTGGWPELATRKPQDEKGSSALSIATAKNGVSYLYVANGGYPGDRGDYQGHVTAINLSTGAQHVFNAVCSDQADVHFVEPPGTPVCSQVQTAIWARAGVIYDSDTDRIYMATGNGRFDPANHGWGDSVFALNPDGTGVNGEPLDSYTPNNFQQLDDTDADLGSTAPAILPVPANSLVRRLAVQGGKDAKLRLLNLDDLSGQGGPGHTGGEIGAVINVPQGGGVLTQPAVWVNPVDGSTWVFVANNSGIAGLQLSVDGSGTPHLLTVWQNTSGGTSPIVANGVLYYAGGNTIQALNPLTGKQLWNDTQIGGIHWESPIVANGILYITDGSSRLTAYSINGVLPSPTPTPAPTPTPTPVSEPFFIHFSDSSYSISKASGIATITVVRSNVTGAGSPGEATVDYSTTDGTAKQNSDYTLAAGTLHFAANEFSKTFTILITDDAYVEGSETINLTLSNPTGNGLGIPSATVLTITDSNTQPPTTNPVDGAQFFVRQHYYDFLNRVPDQGGLDYWTNQIMQCGNDQACLTRDRVAVSAAFFVSAEFQQTGYFVYRVFKASMGRQPSYLEYSRGRSQIIGGPDLTAGRAAYADQVVNPAYVNFSNDQYVDQLYANAGVIPDRAERDLLAQGLNNGTETRGSVLGKVADNLTYQQQEFNPAFVLAEYFGYLRRDPDAGGYRFWLDVLNNRAPNNYQGMVCAFITSAEYQLRFSPVATSTNERCGGAAAGQ